MAKYYANFSVNNGSHLGESLKSSNKFNMEMTMNIDGLKYTTKEINGCWKIKVAGVVEGAKVNTLVGVSGLVGMIGVDMANKLLDRAFRCMGDNQVCKLRRGLKITFYTY